MPRAKARQVGAVTPDAAASAGPALKRRTPHAEALTIPLPPRRAGDAAPPQPTAAPPGSEEKIAVMAERAERRQPLCVAGDATLTESQGYVAGRGANVAAIVEEEFDGSLSIVGRRKGDLAKTKGQRRAA